MIEAIIEGTMPSTRRRRSIAALMIAIALVALGLGIFRVVVDNQLDRARREADRAQRAEFVLAQALLAQAVPSSPGPSLDVMARVTTEDGSPQPSGAGGAELSKPVSPPDETGGEPEIVFDDHPEAGVPTEALTQSRGADPPHEGMRTLREMTDGRVKTVRVRYFNRQTWPTEKQAREYVGGFLAQKSLDVYGFQVWSQGVGVPELECFIEFTDEYRRKLREDEKPYRDGRLLIWQTESCFRDATGRWWFVNAFDYFHGCHPKGNRELSKMSR
jgi:hypothetical protein